MPASSLPEADQRQELPLDDGNALVHKLGAARLVLVQLLDQVGAEVVANVLRTRQLLQLMERRVVQLQRRLVLELAQDALTNLRK